MKTRRVELVVFGVGLLGAVGSWLGCGWWTGLAVRTIERPSDRAIPAAPPPSEPPRPRQGRDTREWRAPEPEPGGGQWVFDLFTPPEIYFDARAKEFTVTPPVLVPAARPESGPPPFDIRLLAVKAPLFRLQLVGYVGGPGNYRGIFENAVTTETFLAASGQRLPGLALTIEEFAVAMTPVALPDSMVTRQRMAVALVRDEGENRTYRLTDAGLCHVAPTALIAAGETTAPCEVSEGRILNVAGRHYKIERISPSPPAIEVTREGTAATGEERRTLFPLAPEGEASPSDPTT